MDKNVELREENSKDPHLSESKNPDFPSLLCLPPGPILLKSIWFTWKRP